MFGGPPDGGAKSAAVGAGGGGGPAMKIKTPIQYISYNFLLELLEQMMRLQKLTLTEKI